jgi:hypothetical protein
MNKKNESNYNPLVSIGASIGSFILIIVAVFAIFAPHQINIAVPISWSLATLGIFLGLFARKK